MRRVAVVVDDRCWLNTDDAAADYVDWSVDYSVDYSSADDSVDWLALRVRIRA